MRDAAARPLAQAPRPPRARMLARHRQGDRPAACRERRHAGRLPDELPTNWELEKSATYATNSHHLHRQLDYATTCGRPRLGGQATGGPDMGGLPQHVRET